MIERVRVIEPPAPIVSIEEARAHLSDLPAEDEAMVTSLILAATTWIDGPTGWLGRPLGIQTLELTTADFYTLDGDYIPLPFCPVLEVVSVRYRGDSGEVIAVPPEDYTADLGGVFSATGKAWPSVSGKGIDNVMIRYKVGSARLTGDPPAYVADVPEPIRAAILLLVAHWYGNREAVVVGAPVNDLPFAVDALLQPYRIYR